MSNPNDTAANIRLAINVMAAYAVGDDSALSWAKAAEVMGQENGSFRLIQGFIGLTGLLLQEFELVVNPPITPAVMLQKMADSTIEYPYLGHT
jgi:hypothetical protein